MPVTEAVTEAKAGADGEFILDCRAAASLGGRANDQLAGWNKDLGS